jgi:hypothetical protein
VGMGVRGEVLDMSGLSGVVFVDANERGDIALERRN